MKTCPQCLSSILQPHPEFIQSRQGWYKCTICAYCERESVYVDDIEEVNQRIKQQNQEFREND